MFLTDPSTKRIESLQQNMNPKQAIVAAISISTWLLIASPSESVRPNARMAHESQNGGSFDISNYGAQPGGDITEAFRKAWNEACRATRPSKIVVPKEKYKLSEVELEGPCKAPIIIQNCGTLQAPENPAEMKSDAWIKIRYVDFLTVDGGGTFDGQGKMAWTQNDCAKNSQCKRPPMNFRFDFVKNSLVTGVTSQDSKNFHVNVLGCKNLTFEKFSIKTADNSLNTDGIHIGRSDGVKILQSKIETGDDCVSLGDGSRDVTIEGVKCGPGHGISIGSLGRYKEEEKVGGILVKDCTLSNTQNGLRIKSWPDLEENTVDGVHFEGITMDNVSNPIILDQEYCPWNQCRGGKPSKVKVSNVSFKDIKGTSATAEAVKILCSPGKCHNLELANIDLKYTGSGKPDDCSSLCKNIKPKIVGTLNPKSTTC